MTGYKLDVPIDISDKSSDRLEFVKRIIHLISGFTTLLTICVDAPIIAKEVKYLGGSAPGPNYTLFVALISIAVPFILVYFPWMYEKHNKFRRGGKFFMKARTNIIFCSFNTFLWATAGIAITVHAHKSSTCTLNPELEESFEDYAGAWTTQCNLAKAASGFTWITCILWLFTLIIAGINFWREKSIVQHRLNEHHMNKQNELESRRQDEENYGYAQGGRIYEEEQSPFVDPHYNNTAFDGHTAGQYVSPGFSPMPEPQHIQPSYHNNNF